MHTAQVAAEARRQAKTKPKSTKSRKTLAERHAAMVDRSGGLFACWPWTGSITHQNGYGQFRAKSPVTGNATMRSAHVVAWELANGRTVPRGKIVRHICHNKLCCNPAHLLLGNEADNRADDKTAGKKHRRLEIDEILAIASLRDEAKATEVAARYRCGITTVRAIWSGQSHTKITGIERNRRKGGRPPKLKLIVDNTKTAVAADMRFAA